MKSFTSSQVCLPVPPPFCFRDLNPCRSGTCPAAPTAAFAQPPAPQPLPSPGCPVLPVCGGGIGENLGQVCCRKLSWWRWASCEGHGETSAMLLGSQQLLQHLPHSERRRAKALKGKEKTPLKLQGGDYLCLRNTLSLYQVGCFCYSELSAFLLCPYHEAFFCFSGLWCLYSTWHCGTAPGPHWLTHLRSELFS